MTTAVNTDLPKGFDCSACGKHHKFVTYVYAHWGFMLTHTCDCGTMHHLRDGIATRAHEVPALHDVSPKP